MLQNYIKTENSWRFLVVLSSLLAIVVAYISLSHGINDLFSFFFLIPMFLVIYRFPKKGILFTVFLGWINITLVYLFGSLSLQDLAVHTAWFYVYVSLGVVVSCIVLRSRGRKEQVDELRKQAFQQIEQNLEQFEILNDQIRNPLQAILLDADGISNDGETKERISKHVQEIQKILSRVDDRILESHKVRQFLRKYYDFK